MSLTPVSAAGARSTAPGVGRSEHAELAQALSAIRARLGLVVLLLALAGLAWWTTAERMAGMDAGPGADLGGLGWFLGVWVVMMAAMMFPALAPTTALYARMTRRRGWAHPLLFTAGYLIVWGGAGLAYYAVYRAGRSTLHQDLTWNAGGRWLAGAILVFAAVYELTPFKDMCLGKCRGPLSFLLGTWREGRIGALVMGCKHAAWCLGCCWALMTALFALGIMSLTWMAVVAALITLEKSLPWRRAATWATAALLLALAIGVLASPHAVPGFRVPHVMHAVGMGN